MRRDGAAIPRRPDHLHTVLPVGARADQGPGVQLRPQRLSAGTAGGHQASSSRFLASLGEEPGETPVGAGQKGRAYLTVTNAFAGLRLLLMSDRDKDAEILTLRHQITVLERQLGNDGVRFSPSDRAFLAALLHRLPVEALRRVRLVSGRTRCSAGTGTW